MSNLLHRNSRSSLSSVWSAVSRRTAAASQLPILTHSRTSLTRLSPCIQNTILSARPSAPSSSFSSKPATASSNANAAGQSPLGVIPIIDLSGTFGTSPEAVKRKKEVASQIDRACRDIGFFTIVGHGIPIDLLDKTWKITQDYFDLAEAEKNRVPMDKDYPYGYSGFGGESLSKGYGEEGRPDPKECFAIGPNNPAADMPAVRWPDNPQEMKKIWAQYYQSMEQLAAHILSIFAIAFQLPENWFEDKIDKHRSALRALNYPKLEKALKAGEVRAGAHTDYGTITILRQDAVGGLQVRNRAMQWVDATPRENSFVINLGDLMARWSNDRWVSTLHRVIQPPKAAAAPPARRQSMAFFHNLNKDAMVECIPTCKSEKHPAKYPPILAWDMLMQKHNSATTY